MHKPEEFKTVYKKWQKYVALAFLKESIYCAKIYPAKGNYRE